MLYDIPGRAGIPIAPETYRRLAEIDSIVAVKTPRQTSVPQPKLWQPPTCTTTATTDDPFLDGNGRRRPVSVTAHVAPHSSVP